MDFSSELDKEAQISRLTLPAKISKNTDYTISLQIDNITVQRCDKNYGFTKTMTSADKTGITACHNEMLSRAQSLIAEHKADNELINDCGERCFKHACGTADDIEHIADS